MHFGRSPFINLLFLSALQGKKLERLVSAQHNEDNEEQAHLLCDCPGFVVSFLLDDVPRDLLEGSAGALEKIFVDL